MRCGIFDLSHLGAPPLAMGGKGVLEGGGHQKCSPWRVYTTYLYTSGHNRDLSTRLPKFQLPVPVPISFGTSRLHSVARPPAWQERIQVSNYPTTLQESGESGHPVAPGNAFDTPGRRGMNARTLCRLKGAEAMDQSVGSAADRSRSHSTNLHGTLIFLPGWSDPPIYKYPGSCTVVFLPHHFLRPFILASSSYYLPNRFSIPNSFPPWFGFACRSRSTLATPMLR